VRALKIVAGEITFLNLVMQENKKRAGARILPERTAIKQLEPCNVLSPGNQQRK